jgi:hypothetical protein
MLGVGWVEELAMALVHGWAGTLGVGWVEGLAMALVHGWARTLGVALALAWVVA